MRFLTLSLLLVLGTILVTAEDASLNSVKSSEATFPQVPPNVIEKELLVKKNNGEYEIIKVREKQNTETRNKREISLHKKELLVRNPEGEYFSFFVGENNNGERIKRAARNGLNIGQRKRLVLKGGKYELVSK